MESSEPTLSSYHRETEKQVCPEVDPRQPARAERRGNSRIATKRARFSSHKALLSCSVRFAEKSQPGSFQEPARSPHDHGKMDGKRRKILTREGLSWPASRPVCYNSGKSVCRRESWPKIIPTSTFGKRSATPSSSAGGCQLRKDISGVCFGAQSKAATAVASEFFQLPGSRKITRNTSVAEWTVVRTGDDHDRQEGKRDAESRIYTHPVR